MFEGENFCGFRGSPFNREYFLTNYGLVDKQYKSISMLLRRFSRE